MAKTLIALALLAALPCAAAEKPYAVLDWPNELNPDVVTLGHDEFLILTDKAFEVWNARTGTRGPASGWPRHTAIKKQWSGLAGGTVVAGMSHTPDKDVPYASLVWWDPQRRAFGPPVVLPPATEVQQLVAIDGQLTLACYRTNVSYEPKAPFTAYAALLHVEGGTLKMAPATAAQRSTLLAAGIRGTVDGTPLGAGTTQSPLIFNTATCKWELADPPKQFDASADATIQPYRLPGGRIAVIPSDGMPLLWDPAKLAWAAIRPARGLDGINGDHYNYGIDGPLVNARGNVVEWFDPGTMRWKVLSSRLPDTYVPILAPLEDGSTVVFTRENGRVLILPPIKRGSAHE